MVINDKDLDNQHERRVKEVLRRSNKWKCAYPGCDNKSIFSHAISRSISLETIAEDGHLVTIRSKRKGDIKEISFGPISVHDATAFNGFCEQHDALFHTLDTSQIDDAKSLMLQAYRTVISEALDESRLASLSADSYQYTDPEEIFSTVNPVDFPEIEDERFRQLILAEHQKIVAAIIRRAADMLKLPAQMLEKLDLLGNQSLEGYTVISTEKMSHHIPFRRLSVQLPVAINCMIHSVFDEEHQYFFFAAIPYTDSTFVFAVVPKAYPQLILDKLMDNFSSDFGLIDLVESVLVGSNEWYMKPSALETMLPEKREIFLHDCTFFNEHRFYDQYDMILLEDARRAVAKAKPELAPFLRLDELQYFPQRESFNTRHERMIAAICAQTFDLREI